MPGFIAPGARETRVSRGFRGARRIPWRAGSAGLRAPAFAGTSAPCRGT